MAGRRRRTRTLALPERNRREVPEGERPCPICGALMESVRMQGILVDRCREHGVWLDNGELAHLVQRTALRNNAARRRKRRARENQGATGAMSAMFLATVGM